MISRVLRSFHFLGWTALVVGLVLQFGIKDRYPVIDLLFYAMPKPCLLALAVALLVWPRSGLKARGWAGVCAVGLGALWVHGSWRAEYPTPSRPRVEAEEVRILFWNLCRPSGLDQEMVDLMKEFQPHFAAFVEPGRMNLEEFRHTYEGLLPGYQMTWMPRGILWFSRVPYRYRAQGKLESIGAFARFEVQGLGPDFPVVVADVYPLPFRSREGQLAEVLNHAQSRSDAILMGDFNTPLESVWLKPFRENYTHALEAAGEGFKETWPLGLPLLSLDHLWLGHDWEVVEARKVWRVPASDHAALLVTLKRVRN